MRIRRIFRPSPAARLRLPLAAATGVGLFALLLSTAVPSDLFGPARVPPELRAAAAEVRVLDGGTLRLGGQVLRLHALQVPERGRAACRDAVGGTVDCAAAAAEALARLVAGHDVACRVTGEDRHGRAFGVCEAGGVALNAALVAAGWAAADGGAAPALAPVEAAARQGGRGIWADAAAWPEGWRRGL